MRVHHPFQCILGLGWSGASTRAFAPPLGLGNAHARAAPTARAATTTTTRQEPETNEQIRERILGEIDAGLRASSGVVRMAYGADGPTDDVVGRIDLDDYGDSEEALVLANAEDKDALDASELGQWTEADFLDKFDYEWDPEAGDEDPNNLDPKHEHVAAPPVDEEGMEVGYDPLYGPANPVDDRTILDPSDSYVIDAKTCDERLVPRDFPEGDPEAEANAEIVSFRKSLKIIETHLDPFLEAEVPTHTAKWHGYQEQLSYPRQNFTNNRFTKPEDKTDFDALGPGRARQVAVQMARAKNNEWLPAGASWEYHHGKKKIYHEMGVLAGSMLPGDIDEDLRAKIRPALHVLGDVVELLSIEVGTVYRFKYYGLIKNKRGMEAWAGVLIRDCDVECTGVVFETGSRKRDPWYDGGDHWHGPYAYS